MKAPPFPMRIASIIAYGLGLAACLACLAARGDTLFLKSGEQLSGTLTSVSDGLVEFDGALSGPMLVAQSQVAAIRTDAPWRITWRDGAAETQRFEGSAKGLEGGRAFSELAAAEPAGRDGDAAAEAGPREDPDAFRAEAGVLQRFGTDDYLAPYIALEYRYGGPAATGEASLISTLPGEEGFADYAEARARWRGRPAETLAPTIELGLARDRPEGLDYRADAGAGLSARIDLENGGEAALVAGLGGRTESWDADDSALEDSVRIWRDGAADRSSLDAMLGFDFRRAFLDGGYIEETIRLRPPLAGDSGMLGLSSTRLGWQFFNALDVRLDVRVEYDEMRVAPEQSRWRGAIGAGVAVRF